jgi:hypothetical protein
MAANISQIKNITAQSFRLFVLTINRMLASSVFKKTKGTGSASNKALKTTPFGRSDAFTRGGFAIMPHATAPLSLMLCAKAYRIYIHTFMKDSYDQNFLTARLFIENNMATLRKLSVSISYFIAAFTNIRIFRQHPK